MATCKYTANTTAYRFKKTHTFAIREDETQFGKGCDTEHRCVYCKAVTH